MSNNKLKILIKIQQPQPHAIEEIYPEPEISYEQAWDRKKIGIAALLLLSLLFVTGSFFFTGERNEKTQHAEQDGFLISIPDETPAAITQSDEKAEAQQPIATTPPHQAAAASKPVIVPAGKPVSKAIANQRNVTEREIPKTAIQSKPRTASDRPEVLRAQLSHAVKAREPVDSVHSVQLHPGESKAVYFYVHLKNLQGQKIRIDWYYNNKLDSHLSLHVHNNNWRTQASKQLDYRRLGAWRVELIDEAGNRLAARNFTVTQS